MPHTPIFLADPDRVLRMLVGALVVAPMLLGLALSALRTRAWRKGLVVAGGWILTISAFITFLMGAFGKTGLSYTPPSAGPVAWPTIVSAAEIVLLVGFAAVGLRIRRWPIVALAAAQLAIVAFEETLPAAHAMHAPAFHLDWLAIIMVLVVSVIGSIVAVYGLPYMKEHEKHLGIAENDSRRPRFFLVVMVFLGAMNGLVLSNDLALMALFWEITTLCSFLLIGHDGTTEARNNAYRALWINLAGGMAFVVGMAILKSTVHVSGIQELLAISRTSHHHAAVLQTAMALLCIAGFTKAAQMPFQSWLLGAMVAPTPVSALLHSSTMVKAGVFIVIRLAPAFHGTYLSDAVGIAGAFTFLSGSLLAIGEANVKKVLAYSTVANLGLVIACAGLNTPLALTAAVMLVIFHAISKALLFMAAGVVEHGIWSRDIEDMQGLIGRMPLTTLLMVVGILSILLPPFGVLIAKLAAIEASVHAPAVLVMLVVGSTLTVVFWTKLMGRLLVAEPGRRFPKIEHLHIMYFIPMVLLATGAVVFSAGVMHLLAQIVEPAVSAYYGVAGIPADPAALSQSVLGVPWLLLFAVLLVATVIPLARFRVRARDARGVYLCGEQVAGSGGVGFRTVGEARSDLQLSGHYYRGIVGELKHSKWMTLAAGLLVAALLVAAQVTA